MAPFGDVAAGGPATFPDPNVFTNGAWYSGTPYFGPDANLRAGTPGCIQNALTSWQPQSLHQLYRIYSLRTCRPTRLTKCVAGRLHRGTPLTNARLRPTTFSPARMLMMMLVDSREFVIDESLL